MTENDPELDFIRRYTSDMAVLLRRIDPGPITAAISALHGAWQTGKVVLFCGNGGSGASCSHIVNDFQRGCGLKAICLNDNMPIVSAVANDIAYSEVFVGQVNTWSERNGVLVALSGSGNSKNVLNAVHEAHETMTVIALTGFDGGALKETCDISIHVPADNMQQAEDVHMVLLHLLYLGLQRRIRQEAGEPL